MSTTFTKMITPAEEQQELLQQLRHCDAEISNIKAGRVKKAIEALKRATHHSPLLAFLDPAGREELFDRLEDELEGDEQPETKAWVRKCLKDLEAYEKVEEKLSDAEARIAFYEAQAQNAQELFIYTMM